MKLTPEGHIKRAICDFLAYQPDVFFWEQESQGTYDPRRKIFRKKKGYQMNGIPDLLICLQVNGIGCFVGFEVKSKTGTQRESQVEFESRFSARGGLYFLVRSVDDAVLALNDARAILRGKWEIQRSMGPLSSG